MPHHKKAVSLTIETLILVAVWENPFVFQGCIKITEPHRDNTVLFFFRCQSSHKKQHDILTHDFSSDDYEFTHMYNELGRIPLGVNTINPDPAQEYALDMMKYALHVTLKEMISNRKIHFTSIDDVAMQAMINKIKPILNQEVNLPEEEHIGFAVAMDFHPQEKIECLAALALLNKLENPMPSQ